jgi:tRNA(fMet)-specific endonuclease VapC
MPGIFLLDTTAAIALIGNEPLLLAILGGADRVVIPVAVVGELYYGALKSGRQAENLARVEALLAANIIVEATVDTAMHYGRIRQQLQAKGRPIPENDIWIAAAALQHGLAVITRDAHFAEVDGLNTVGW